MDEPAKPARPPDHRAFVTVGGLRLDVHRYGAGARGDDGPALVFLHEGLGSAEMWRDFPAKVAAATGRSAVVYSRQGYGTSDPRSETYRPDFMHREARDVLPELLSALDVERPVLIGHSDGASIALIHAADHPVSALVLEAPHIFVEDVCIRSIAEIHAKFANGELAAALGRYHADPVHAFEGWSGAWLDPAFANWSLRDLVPRIDCPILAIQGENDQYGTMDQVDAIAESAGGPVRLLKLPDCGHAPHRDRPGTVLRAIAGFIAQPGRHT